MQNKRSLTLIEFLIIICIILVLGGTFGTYLNITLKVARETALINELSNIRMSIEHYRIINGKLPENLPALIKKGFTLRNPDGIIFGNRFLNAFKVDKDGYLLDPFMNRYYYDVRDGKVRAQTKGYESW